MSSIELIRVHPGSPLVDRVWELYRKNAKTLGFLPRGALDEFAASDRVIAATHSNMLLGYVAWRRSRGEVVIVHLCVSEDHRGGDCVDRLLKALFDRCRDDAAIRLRCRKDYAAANKIWPKYGFAVEQEIVGRGADAKPLFVWRRVHREDAPIIEAIKATKPRATSIVAMDANVFFDLISLGSVHHEESSSLLADWLDDVSICVTRELRNEISRREDTRARQDALSYLQRFEELAGHPDDVDNLLSQLNAILPEALKTSDHSDRRQLAHAWAGGANYFATRDEVLLSHATGILKVAEIVVMRPGDIVTRLHGDMMGDGYAPARLHGTSIECRPATSEDDLLPFQCFASYETKASWLAAIRTARSAPTRYTIELIGPKGEQALVAICIDMHSPGILKIHFLRCLSSLITPTLLRRVLADVIERARVNNCSAVKIGAVCNDQIGHALHELDFVDAQPLGMVRYIIPGVDGRQESIDLIDKLFPQAVHVREMSAPVLEAKFWPLKIIGEEIESYIVPIKPYWASALFDRNLAAQGLFDVPERVALALENVYYSASNIIIPEGSRIIWYVSGKVQEIRAISSCLGTSTDTASNLSRRHHRLGAYEWRDVLAAAGGKPDSILHAYMFSRTELMVDPVPWIKVKELIHRHMNNKNSVASPVRVPESFFHEVYSLGIGGRV